VLPPPPHPDRDMASAILASAHNSLPTELVILIVEHLSDNNQALCTLARTSRALQHLAEEQIYKTIELFTVRDLHNIVQAFTYRHDRVRAVHTLKLQYQYHEKDLGDNLEIRRTFNECIAHMVNLREWHVESPYDNCHWNEGEGPQQWVESDMERFRAALEHACVEGPAESERIQAERRLGNIVDRTVGLALLESLTIHSHGIDSDFWELGGYHCLFRHPTLRHLHISCVSFTEIIPKLRMHNGKKTPLTTLEFNECEISPEALTDILRMPASLKYLTLGENVWNTRRSKRIKPRLTQNAAASLEALGAVAHSLESLTHWDPSWKLDLDSHKPRRINPPGDGMRNFHALRYIQCETTSFLHQAIIMNHEVAPPNLETLRLCRHWNEPVDFFEHPPNVETYLALPSLKTLELMQSSWCWLEMSMADYVCDEERLRNRHAYAYKLYKAGINLKVLIEMHRDGSLIPPFLYGEPTPITDCVYDAEDVGFVHQTSSPSDRQLIGDLATSGDQDIKDMEAQIEEARKAYDAEKGSRQRQQHETDQLDESEITYIKHQTQQILLRLKKKFIGERRLRRAESILEFVDENGDDDDMEMDLDEEWDEDDVDFEMDGDDANVIFHEHNGELYIEVYESETDEDEDDDEEIEDAEVADAAGDIDAHDHLD
jgi:hypothetical protein